MERIILGLPEMAITKVVSMSPCVVEVRRTGEDLFERRAYEAAIQRQRRQPGIAEYLVQYADDIRRGIHERTVKIKETGGWS